MTSLRRRLTIWLLAATAVLAITAGTSLYLYVRSAIYWQFDSALRARLQAIASLLRVENDGSYAMDFSIQSMPEYLARRHAQYFQVFLPDGKTLERSQSLKGHDLLPAAGVKTGKSGWDILLPNGRSGRAMAMLAKPLPEDEDQDEPNWRHAKTTNAAAPALVVVAMARHRIDEILSSLLSALIVAAVVLAIAAILVVHFIVAQALKPVNLLADQANHVGPRTLGYRFDIDAMPLELRPIAQRLNDLLMRLDEAFSRQRRLNADIAHELRTPIAELRSLSDIAGRWPGDRAQSQAYFQDAHDIAVKMGDLVETLLALAHSQSGAVRANREAIELRQFVEGLLAPYRQTIADRELHVSTSLPDNCEIESDRMMFGRVLDNLIANAVSYAPRGGSIQFRGEMQGDCWQLKIGNANDSLMKEDLTEMFEPFWRKDSARSDGKHSGLGLALVTEFATQLGIQISCQLQSPEWFEMTLRLPAAASQKSDAHHVPVTLEPVN